jgi:hypothetical protein
MVPLPCKPKSSIVRNLCHDIVLAVEVLSRAASAKLPLSSFASRQGGLARAISLAPDCLLALDAM